MPDKKDDKIKSPADVKAEEKAKADAEVEAKAKADADAKAKEDEINDAEAVATSEKKAKEKEEKAKADAAAEAEAEKEAAEKEEADKKAEAKKAKEDKASRIKSEKAEEEAAEEAVEDVDYLRKYQIRKNTVPGSMKSDPRPGTKAYRMKETLLGQPKVRTMIPRKHGSSPKIKLTVNLNGYRLDFPTNTYIYMPQQISEVLMESLEQTEAAILRGQIGENDKAGIEDALM